MKKILVLLLSVSLLFSCSDTKNNKDKALINSDVSLEEYFDDEAKSLNIRSKWLTKVPDFNTLPDDIKEEVVYITLIDNDISSFSDEDFEMFPSLQEINLWYNNISEVDFSNDSVKIISFTKNKITKVDLSWSDNLATINLSFNKIESVSDLDLPRVNLTQLLLNSNNISDIKDLKELYNLVFLRLEFNSVELEELVDVLSELPNIKFITTAGNSDIPKEKTEKLNKWSLENKIKYNLAD